MVFDDNVQSEVVHWVRTFNRILHTRVCFTGRGAKLVEGGESLRGDFYSRGFQCVRSVKTQNNHSSKLSQGGAPLW